MIYTGVPEEVIDTNKDGGKQSSVIELTGRLSDSDSELGDCDGGVVLYQ